MNNHHFTQKEIKNHNILLIANINDEKYLMENINKVPFDYETFEYILLNCKYKSITDILLKSLEYIKFPEDKIMEIYLSLSRKRRGSPHYIFTNIHLSDEKRLEILNHSDFDFTNNISSFFYQYSNYYDENNPDHRKIMMKFINMIIKDEREGVRRRYSKIGNITKNFPIDKPIHPELLEFILDCECDFVIISLLSRNHFLSKEHQELLWDMEIREIINNEKLHIETQRLILQEIKPDLERLRGNWSFTINGYLDNEIVVKLLNMGYDNSVLCCKNPTKELYDMISHKEEWRALLAKNRYSCENAELMNILMNDNSIAVITNLLDWICHTSNINQKAILLGNIIKNFSDYLKDKDFVNKILNIIGDENDVDVLLPIIEDHIDILALHYDKIIDKSNKYYNAYYYHKYIKNRFAKNLIAF
jgi:hypothetical protein